MPNYVQIAHHGLTGTASTDSAAFAVNATVGNLIVVTVLINGSINNPTPTVSSITGFGTIGTVRAVKNNGSGATGARVEIWSLTCLTAGTTLAIGYTGQTGTSHINAGLIIAEYATYAEIIDGAVSTNSASSAVASSGNAITAHANDLLVAGVASDILTTPSAPTNSFVGGFGGAVAGVGTGNDLAGPLGEFSSDRVVTATGTYSTGWTVGSGNWSMALVAFKQGGAPTAIIAIPAAVPLSSQFTEQLGAPGSQLGTIDLGTLGTTFTNNPAFNPAPRFKGSAQAAILSKAVTPGLRISIPMAFVLKFWRYGLALPWQPIRLGRSLRARALFVGKAATGISTQAVNPARFLRATLSAAATILADALTIYAALRRTAFTSITVINQTFGATGAAKTAVSRALAILTTTQSSAARFVPKAGAAIIAQAVNTATRLPTALTYIVLLPKLIPTPRLAPKIALAVFTRAVNALGPVKTVPAATLAALTTTMGAAGRFVPKVGLTLLSQLLTVAPRLVRNISFTALLPKISIATRLITKTLVTILTDAFGAGAILKVPVYGVNAIVMVIAQALSPLTSARKATSAIVNIIARAFNPNATARTIVTRSVTIIGSAMLATSRLVPSATTAILAETLGAMGSIATTLRNLSGSFQIIAQSFAATMTAKMPVTAALAILNQAAGVLTVFKLRPNIIYAITNSIVNPAALVKIFRPLIFAILSPTLAAGYIFSRIIHIISAALVLLTQTFNQVTTIQVKPTATVTILLQGIAARSSLTIKRLIAVVAAPLLSPLAAVRTIASGILNATLPKLLGLTATKFQQAVVSLLALLPRFINLPKVTARPSAAIAIGTQALTTATRTVARIATLITTLATTLSPASIARRAASVFVIVPGRPSIATTIHVRVAALASVFLLPINAVRVFTTASIRTIVTNILNISVAELASDFLLVTRNLMIPAITFTTSAVASASRFINVTFSVADTILSTVFVIAGDVRGISGYLAISSLKLLQKFFPFTHRIAPVVIVFDAELDRVIAFDAKL